MEAEQHQRFSRRRFASFMAITVLYFAATALSYAQAPSFHEKAKLLGQPILIDQVSDAQTVGTGSEQQISQQTSTKLLGHKVQILKLELKAAPAVVAEDAADVPISNSVGAVDGASAVAAVPSAGTVGAPPSATSTPSGVVLNQHDLYIGGVRVWNGNLRYDQGSLIYSGGIAPTQVPIPVFAYPLGPVLLQIDAGVEFEGDLQAKLTPGPSYPIQDSSLGVQLSAKLYAAAYVEAYAKLLFLRGGVGGRINVVDANAGYQGFFYIGGYKPQMRSYGYARLLNGRVYGFVDVWFFRWSRMINRDFFNWPGKCLNFTASGGAGGVLCGS